MHGWSPDTSSRGRDLDPDSPGDHGGIGGTAGSPGRLIVFTGNAKNAGLGGPGLPGYQRIYWCVALPMQDVAKEIGPLLLAVANLEQTERVAHVVDVTIHADPDEPSRRTAAVTLSTLIPVAHRGSSSKTVSEVQRARLLARENKGADPQGL